MRLAFGDCVIDFGERRVFSGRQELHLTPKAFDLLRLLIENRPKALAKQEIFDRLWPGTFVSENTFPSAHRVAEPGGLDDRGQGSTIGEDLPIMRLAFGDCVIDFGERRRSSPSTVSRRWWPICGRRWATRQMSPSSSRSDAGEERR
jgi:hypothetical protein